MYKVNRRYFIKQTQTIKNVKNLDKKQKIIQKLCVF